jgi:hypothetical protein
MKKIAACPPPAVMEKVNIPERRKVPKMMNFPGGIAKHGNEKPNCLANTVWYILYTTLNRVYI